MVIRDAVTFLSLVCVVALPARAAAFVISEIHYHPPVGQEALEFIEISNDSLTPQDLSGYRFVEGISFEFPPGTILEGGGSLVLCADADAVRAHYGIEGVLGNYEGRLDGGGERLTIVNFADREVQSVRYDDQGKWPVGPDGTGHTLVIRSVYDDPSEPESWTQSPELGGSPGRANFPEGREPEYDVTVFVEAGEEWRYMKGTQPFSDPPLAWTEEDFDDSGWLAGPSGFGYDDDDDTTILDDMRGVYTSVAVRKRLVLTQDDLDAPGDYFLGVTFDDGVCGFVNGTEVGRLNCPDDVVWDSRATRSQNAGEERLFFIERSLLRAGENIVALVGFNRRTSDSDFTLIPRVIHRRLIEEDVRGVIRLSFNELYRGDGSGNGWVEIYNREMASIQLTGLRLTDDPARPDPYEFPAGAMIDPGGFLVLEEAGTSLDLSGEKVQLFLIDPDGFVLASAAFDQNFPEHVDPAAFSEARMPDGGRPGWLTDVLTPGAENVVPRVTTVVINEIFYRPPEGRDGEFLELYNRGTEAVDLTGFRFSRGVGYTFPPGSILGAGEYVVVAQDPEILREHYGLRGVFGPWEGQLADSGENVRLVDTLGNLVDEVRYWDGGRWSQWADGRGSSLELIDPRQDNDFAAAWGPSDETQKAEWEEHSFMVDYAPAGESELHLLLAERGICLVDDLNIATQAFDETPLLDVGAEWRYAKGTEAFSDPPLAWTEVEFDDSGWLVGPSGIGFGDEGYATVLDDMRRSYSSVAARATFEVTRDILDLPGEIFLAIDFDDGFCAFLNGVELAQAYCPAELVHEETASRSRNTGEEDLFPIPPERLRVGRNHLAVVGYNRSISSSDFGLVPRVVHLRPDGLGENHIPNPGFEEDTRPWRIEGTHVDSRRITRDAHSGNACLEIVATGKGDSTCNRIETDTSPRMRAQQYLVSLWTRWQRGTSLLIVHGEFATGPREWFGTRDVNMTNNSLGARLRMSVPWNLGTPGTENGLRSELRARTGSGNLGPVIAEVRHSPLSPDEGERTRVVARVADADGVKSVRVFYKEDTTGEYDSAPLFDDGDHGDAGAGDGLYGGQIPGFGRRTDVVFFVEAVDGLDVAGRFPVEAPDRTLLYMVEGAVPEQIQIAMSSASRTELDRRVLHSNDLVDGTFIFKNDDVYYNVGLRYRGSPWGRPQKQSYRVRFPKDQRYHRGRKDINISQRDSHDGMWTFLIARNSSRQVPAPAADYQYVATRIDGRSFQIPGVFESVDRDFLRRWFGQEALDDIVCLKALGRLRFSDSCQRTGWDEATLAHMDTYSENYRFYWGQSIHQTRDSWEQFMELTKVMDPNQTSDAEFAQLIDSVLDVEAFLRVMMPRMLMNDGDAIFLGNGHNGYMVWNPLTGLWGLLPFDMGFASVVGTNLTSVRDRQVARLFRTPHTLRVQYRLADEYASGYWSEKATPWLQALQRSPGRRGSSQANQLRTSSARLKSRLERYTEVEFRILTNDGEDFETEAPQIELEGMASVRVTDLLYSINGSEPERLELAWSGGTTPTRWSATIHLAGRENRIQVFGVDAHGEVTEEAGITVTLPRSADAPFIRGDARPDRSVNVSDAIAVLAHLFRGLSLPCPDAADADDNGRVEIADALLITDYLFLEGQPPAAPFPDPGEDATEDALGCDG